MKSRLGFTLIELLVVLAIIAVLLGLLLPALSNARTGTMRLKDATQLRQVQMGMAYFSEINAGLYPGVGRQLDANADGFVDIDMDHDGVKDAEGDSVEGRMWELLSRQFFTGELAISPFERKTVWAAGHVTSDNYSYARLDIDDIVDGKAAGRGEEWKATLNSKAPMMCDRNIGPVNPLAQQVQSYSASRPGNWIGNVAFNDERVAAYPSPITTTQFGQNKITVSVPRYAGFAATDIGDYLFGDEDVSNPMGFLAGYDADMIHWGDETNGDY